MRRASLTLLPGSAQKNNVSSRRRAAQKEKGLRPL
jgi:hypothetical protein